MLVFIDIETTGLEPEEGSILEIAAVTTTDDFQIVGQPFSQIVLPNEANWFDSMDPFVKAMHEKSGLIADIPVNGLPLKETMNEFLRWWPKSPNYQTPMCGSSVHFDRAWLKHHAPAIEAQFTYRNLDATSVRFFFEGVKAEVKQPESRKRHRALDDVQDSVRLLRVFATHYRDRENAIESLARNYAKVVMERSDDHNDE